MTPAPIRLHAHKPLADGICFDDLSAFDMDQRNMLASRGVVFVTEFKANGRRYGGSVIATSWPHAEEIAFGRGLGEEVIGVLAKTWIDR